MFLDEAELAVLTQRVRSSAQAKVLAFMGIDYKLRPDGSLVVLRSHVEKQFGEGTTAKARRKTTPRFDLVH